MQRKISNIKYKLHSIPILLNMKNKSNVLYSIPCVKSCACNFCRVVNTLRSKSSNNAYSVQNNNNSTSSNSHSTNVVRWTSPHLKNQTRSSRIMTPYSRISSWSKTVVFTFLLLIVSFLSSIILNNGSSCYAASASLTLGTTGTISSNATAGSVAYVSNTITASASDVSSYSLTITGPTNLITEGSSESGSSTTITGANSNKPSTMPNNSWGYSYNEGALSNDNKTYKSFTGSAQTLESGTTPSNTAKNITFAAKFGEDAISGHYKANIILSLVATPATTTYTITYNANGGSGAPSSTPCTTQGAAGTSCTTTLSSTKPTLTNNNLLGWSTNKDSHTAEYSANGSITISSNITLYAIWKDTRNISQITNMQDMNWGICDNTSTGTAKTLTDNRTYPSGVSKTYTVRKMEDGKCWMTQNLRLTGSSLTSSNSNVSTSYTIPTSSISSFNTTNTTQAAYYHSATNTAYYTWCVATANTCGSFTSNGANSTYNICPKGWTLPTGGTGAGTDSHNLFANMGLTISNSLPTTVNMYVSWGSGDLAKVQGSPYNFAYTGRVNNDTMSNTSDGFWWSRTAYGSERAYNLSINSSGVFPGNYGYHRYVGNAVRCVAQ